MFRLSGNVRGELLFSRLTTAAARGAGDFAAEVPANKLTSLPMFSR